MKRGHIRRECITGQDAAVKKTVEKLAGTRRLPRALFVLLRCLLGFHVFIFAGFLFGIGFPGTGSNGIIDRSQAIIFHFKEKVPAVILGKLTGHP